MWGLLLVSSAVLTATGLAAIMAYKRQQGGLLRSLGIAPSAPSKAGPGQVFDPRFQSGGRAHHIVDVGRFGRGLLGSLYGRPPRPATGTRPAVDTPHHGIDITAPAGTVVRAALNGIVVESRPIRGYGEAIAITHPSINQSTLYAHLSRRVVELGDEVQGGQVIGMVGNTCMVPGEPVPCWCRTQPVRACPQPRGSQTMGAHLHFEVHPTPTPNFAPNFRRLDPERWLRDRSRNILVAAWEMPPGSEIVDFGDL